MELTGASGEVKKLEWRVFRAKETPVRTAIAGVFIAAFLGFTFWYFGVLLAIVALLALFVALHTYFLPVRYVLDGEGITVDKRIFSHTYPWDQFRRWFRTTGGVVVSPFSRRTFLDNFRGVHLLLPRDPAAVLAHLERRLPARKRGPLDTEGRRATMDAEDSQDETETTKE